MRRIRLKRRIYLFKKKNKPKIIILIIIALIICIKLILNFINTKVNPVLSEYAELESRKLTSIVINNSISKNISQNIDMDNLFIITKDENDNIKSIDFNPITVNKTLTDITKNIQNDLINIENGNIEVLEEKDLNKYDKNKLKEGIICEIPTGVIFGNSFLANIGPKIPVRFSLMGDIISHINTNVTNYGINNAVIQINIVLEIQQQVILPFLTNKINIKTSIPVAIKLVQGEIPNYYLNGFNQNSHALALPIE